MRAKIRCSLRFWQQEKKTLQISIFSYNRVKPATNSFKVTSNDGGLIVKNFLR
jgi:hypothetical protein